MHFGAATRQEEPLIQAAHHAAYMLGEVHAQAQQGLA